MDTFVCHCLGPGLPVVPVRNGARKRVVFFKFYSPYRASFLFRIPILTSLAVELSKKTISAASFTIKPSEGIRSRRLYSRIYRRRSSSLFGGICSKLIGRLKERRLLASVMSGLDCIGILLTLRQRSRKPWSLISDVVFVDFSLMDPLTLRVQNTIPVNAIHLCTLRIIEDGLNSIFLSWRRETKAI